MEIITEKRNSINFEYLYFFSFFNNSKKYKYEQNNDNEKNLNKKLYGLFILLIPILIEFA